MAKLSIELSGNRTAYAPGETIEGRVEWQSDANPAAVELSLLWYTSGKGTRDVGVIDTHRVEHPGSFGSDSFRLTLPSGPYSFSGRLVSLIWTLELTCTPGDETVRQEIVLSPTGKEIVLPSIGPMSPIGSIRPTPSTGSVDPAGGDDRS